MDTRLLLRTVLICGYFILAFAFFGAAQGIVFEPSEAEEEKVEKAKHPWGHMGAAVGVAIPFGQFASKDYRNFFAGYADPGFSVNFIDVQHQLSKHFGVSVEWSRHQFGYAHDSVANLLRDNISDASFEAQSSDPWVLQAALINGVATIPGKVVDLDVKLGVGFFRANRPEVEVVGYDLTSGALSYSWLQRETAENAPMIGMGMNLRFHLLDDLDLILAGDYQRAGLTMDVTSTYGLNFTETDALDQSFELMTLGAGLALRI